ncbi:MAG: hypothetical protein HDQ96_05715 [Lachnospiraceae bacterium]|nr:hypothetical protein [Lachnospiraceae bacterium]
MRCGRCGKNFDEEMYSGVCPKCGHFNNRQTEYDVNKYISAKFEDGAKTSTSAQAAKQHVELHKMYDSQNMHKAGAGSHEQLHKAYDKNNGHGQTAPASGYQAGRPLGKPNPYQSAAVQGNTYQAGQTGSYQQGSYPKQAQYGPNRTYQAGKNGSYGQANAYDEKKKKNIITPICIVIAILAVSVTVVCCYLKEQSMEETYSTLDFEQETAQPGELFEVYERLFIVDKARVVDTSALEGMPRGEKLVAVAIELLPADKSGDDDVSGEVYVSDGSSFKMSLDSYTMTEILYDGDYSMRDGIFSGYDFQGYISMAGRTGDLYFFVDENAEEITISFDEGNKKDGIYALQRRVSVSLQLEEDGI